MTTLSSDLAGEVASPVAGALHVRRRVVEALLIVALAVVVLVPHLGAKAISHFDEGYYIGAALEATGSGEWVVPLHDGKFNDFLGKPPLSYALIGGAVAFFGESKVVFRLPTVVCGIVVLLLLWAIGERAVRGAGLAAALLLVCSPAWATETRRIWLETPVVMFDLAAFLVYAEARVRRSVALTVAAGLLLAAALMTKQLAAGFGVAAIALAELMSGRGHWRRCSVTVLIALVPLVVWAVLLYARIGDQALTLWSFHVQKGVLVGHSHQARKPDDYLAATVQFLGLGTVALGLVGLGWVAVRRQLLAPAARFIVAAGLAYVLLSIVVVGLLARSFRVWYPRPAAHVIALGAGLALVASWRWWFERRDTIRELPLAIGAVGVFATLQSYGVVDANKVLGGYALAVTLALALAATAGRVRDRERAWHAAAARWAPMLALFIAGVIGYRASVAKNVTGAPRDEIEQMVAQLAASHVDGVVAEPRFFSEEFLFYLKGLPLVRAPAGAPCATPPAGQRYAYLAEKRAPACWKSIRGREAVADKHHYLIMEAPQSE